MSIDDTLAARESRYGDFADNASYAQEIKATMRRTSGWLRLLPFQREALELIASKIGRMLSGDPNYKDNWHDIGGYARLVEDRLGKGDTCQAAITQHTSKNCKKPPERSKSVKPEIRPATILNGTEGFIRATDSTSTTETPSQRAARIPLQTGEFGPDTPTDPRGI